MEKVLQILGTDDVTVVAFVSNTADAIIDDASSLIEWATRLWSDPFKTTQETLDTVRGHERYVIFIALVTIFFMRSLATFWDVHRARVAVRIQEERDEFFDENGWIDYLTSKASIKHEENVRANEVAKRETRRSRRRARSTSASPKPPGPPGPPATSTTHPIMSLKRIPPPFTTVTSVFGNNTKTTTSTTTPSSSST